MLSRNMLPWKIIIVGALLGFLVSACNTVPSPPLDEADPTMRCNGFEALCARPLNEVAFAATHNSMSNEDAGWWEPNQQHGLTKQMEDGIRGMLLDSYEVDGELWLCHGFCELGGQPLAEGLGEIRDFLVSHPHEVMILFFQDAVGSERMSQAITDAELGALVYTHGYDGPFPTLGEMILAGTRLVISSESDGPPPDWYHHGWDLFFDTPYSFKGIDEFSCELYRGDENNPLFLLNHWLSDPSGLPDPEGATDANSFEVLYKRASDCWAARGQIPNLVTVDFYATGDLISVVNKLNGTDQP